MKQQLTIFVATWISQQPWIGWRGAANIEGSCEYLMQAAKTKVGWNYYPIIQWNYYAPLDYIEVQHKNISSRVISKKEQRDLVDPPLIRIMDIWHVKVLLTYELKFHPEYQIKIPHILIPLHCFLISQIICFWLNLSHCFNLIFYDWEKVKCRISTFWSCLICCEVVKEISFEGK